MEGIKNENQLTIVKEYEFDKRLIHKIDFNFDLWFKDCHDKYFHTFDYKGVYNINFTNNAKYDSFNLPVSDKNMNLYEIKEIKVARHRGHIFNQIQKLTIKNYGNLSNLQYYLKLPIPKTHRQFFE